MSQDLTGIDWKDAEETEGRQGGQWTVDGGQ